MGTDDFQKRLERIGSGGDVAPSATTPRKRTAPSDGGFGLARVLWGIFGILWGFAANTMVMFANTNYERAKADVDAPEMLQLVAATGALGIISWLLFIILGVLSFLFLRQKKGLRILVFGFLIGVAIASLGLKMAAAGGGAI